MKTMTQDEFLAEAKRRFGDNVREWKFVCPMCGTVQSVQELLDVVVASGLRKDQVHQYIGYSCIGRFTGQGDAGIAARNKNEKWDKGCNWTLGGLLQCHELEVIMPDGHRRPTFELAQPARAELEAK